MLAVKNEFGRYYALHTEQLIALVLARIVLHLAVAGTDDARELFCLDRFRFAEQSKTFVSVQSFKLSARRFIVPGKQGEDGGTDAARRCCSKRGHRWRLECTNPIRAVIQLHTCYVTSMAQS